MSLRKLTAAVLIASALTAVSPSAAIYSASAENAGGEMSEEVYILDDISESAAETETISAIPIIAVMTAAAVFASARRSKKKKDE